jgi:hypothetical protein
MWGRGIKKGGGGDSLKTFGRCEGEEWRKKYVICV